MRNRRKQRKNIDPKTLKKHSSILHERSGSDVVVLGFKEETKTGYMIPGHSGSKFVTFFEVMLPGSATGLYMHPEKERTIRILAGQGFVLLQNKDVEGTQISVGPGDEVAFKPGVTYRISTTSITPLEMFVAQDKRYGDGLSVLEPVTPPTDPALIDLTPNAKPDEVERQRGPSKAALQQVAVRGQSAVSAEEKAARRPVQDAGSGIVIGASPRPGGPNQFGDAGAG
jgi:mannose-6-phosphate isomerase-like protein (cupin superfamily)